MLQAARMNKTRLFGLLCKPDYHRAKHALEHLHRELPEQFSPPECVQMMEYQWKHFTQQLRKDHGGEVWEFSGDIAVFCNDQFIGDLLSFLPWVAENYGYQDPQSLPFYVALAKEVYNAHITNPERYFVFMDVCIEGDLIGRVVFELYRHQCPKTCANFVALCTGEKGTSKNGTRLSYVNSIFHRVVPNGWIQGGDICGGSGAMGESIYGSTFEDECFAVAHDSSGVLGLVNHGRNTNNSQFYITLKPASWMDRQYVGFGRVVEGAKVLQRLESVETYNERPKELCQVSNCGILQPEPVE